MMYEIPLTAEPQRFEIALAGDLYQLTVYWSGQTEGGWLLDIATAEGGKALLAGIPLVTGTDLLRQYQHLQIGGMLWCFSQTDLPPSLGDLGVDTKLIFETEDEK